MQEHLITNLEQLATSENRKLALNIAQAGLAAINTEDVIENSIKLRDNILKIMGQDFDLSKYGKIKVVGFGKASPQAALAIEKILGDRIKEGAVVGLSKVPLQFIESFAGTHPRPSKLNAEAGERIHEIIKDSGEDDLIIVLVSGGGSALLCYGENEYMQGARVYDSFLNSGKTIAEMNTVRKHTSFFKGGGLAKIAYPATVIGLIFSDVPGDNFENVASGPTYPDMTTVADAEAIIAENNLGQFDLIETPKEEKYFEKVHNLVLVSNRVAVEAMENEAKKFGISVKVISTAMYDQIGVGLNKIFSARSDNSAVLAAGELSIEVKNKSGIGGRNLHTGLEAIKMNLIDGDSVFVSLASDGMDNSDAAGVIVDQNTLEKAKMLGLDVNDYVNRFDSYNFFQRTEDIIMTGPTGANVSDLMILLTKK